MKKTNRDKSLRIRVLIATLTAPLIIGMSGCSNNKKEDNKPNNIEQELETLLNSSKRAYELESAQIILWV